MAAAAQVLIPSSLFSLHFLRSLLAAEERAARMLPGVDEKVTRRRKWNDEEDAHLLELVRIHGGDNWRNISACMDGRDSKQCRERFMNHLDPSVKKGRLTADEWLVLSKAHEELGNKCASSPPPPALALTLALHPRPLLLYYVCRYSVVDGNSPLDGPTLLG